MERKSPFLLFLLMGIASQLDEIAAELDLVVNPPLAVRTAAATDWPRHLTWRRITLQLDPTLRRGGKILVDLTHREDSPGVVAPCMGGREAGEPRPQRAEEGMVMLEHLSQRSRREKGGSEIARTVAPTTE